MAASGRAAAVVARGAGAGAQAGGIRGRRPRVSLTVRRDPRSRFDRCVPRLDGRAPTDPLVFHHAGAVFRQHAHRGVLHDPQFADDRQQSAPLQVQQTAAANRHRSVGRRRIAVHAEVLVDEKMTVRNRGVEEPGRPRSAGPAAGAARRRRRFESAEPGVRRVIQRDPAPAPARAVARTVAPPRLEEPFPGQFRGRHPDRSARTPAALVADAAFPVRPNHAVEPQGPGHLDPDRAASGPAPVVVVVGAAARTQRRRRFPGTVNAPARGPGTIRSPGAPVAAAGRPARVHRRRTRSRTGRRHRGPDRPRVPLPVRGDHGPGVHRQGARDNRRPLAGPDVVHLRGTVLPQQTDRRVPRDQEFPVHGEDASPSQFQFRGVGQRCRPVMCRPVLLHPEELVGRHVTPRKGRVDEERRPNAAGAAARSPGRRRRFESAEPEVRRVVHRDPAPAPARAAARTVAPPRLEEPFPGQFRGRHPDRSARTPAALVADAAFPVRPNHAVEPQGPGHLDPDRAASGPAPVVVVVGAAARTQRRRRFPGTVNAPARGPGTIRSPGAPVAAAGRPARVHRRRTRSRTGRRHRGPDRPRVAPAVRRDRRPRVDRHLAGADRDPFPGPYSIDHRRSVGALRHDDGIAPNMQPVQDVQRRSARDREGRTVGHIQSVDDERGSRLRDLRGPNEIDGSEDVVALDRQRCADDDEVPPVVRRIAVGDERVGRNQRNRIDVGGFPCDAVGVLIHGRAVEIENLRTEFQGIDGQPRPADEIQFVAVVRQLAHLVHRDRRPAGTFEEHIIGPERSVEDRPAELDLHRLERVFRRARGNESRDPETGFPFAGRRRASSAASAGERRTGLRRKGNGGGRVRRELLFHQLAGNRCMRRTVGNIGGILRDLLRISKRNRSAPFGNRIRKRFPDGVAPRRPGE